MKINLKELFKNKNILLYRSGAVYLVLFVGLLLLYFIDDRMLLGINIWIKPIKFALSTWIYMWTIAIILPGISNARKEKIISWGITLSLAIEIFLVVMQASRGIQSHFNITSAANGIIFSAMGILILINTLFVVWLLILYFSTKITFPKAFTWGIRIGLILFILAGYEGFIMASKLTHTVGGLDGGPGLPILNWSTAFGDLRVAHFLGLHSLQVCPLIALTLINFNYSKPVLMTIVLSVLYGSLCFWMFYRALNGLPMF